MALVRLTLALGGDTMLGRGVADALEHADPHDLVAPEVAEPMRAADLCLVNLECCISERGERWADPHKPFFFRAPPLAAEFLEHLGVDAVTLANNHALDYGPTALLDTLEHLAGVGIGCVGAGRDEAAARQPLLLESGGLRVAVLGVTDHPRDYAAARSAPGVAYGDLHRGLPPWLVQTVRAVEAELTVVTAHWGPNMAVAPVPHVHRAAEALSGVGVPLVVGHSAHVFHGVRLHSQPRPAAILYDLGDFLDDYATDPTLRNDLGLLWEVTVTARGPIEVAGLPLRLDYAYTRLAEGEDRSWISARLSAACAPFGSTVQDTGHRLVVLPG